MLTTATLLVLGGTWTVVAWILGRTIHKALPCAKSLRVLGVFNATYWMLFYAWLLLGHAGLWSVFEWHNELARFGAYLTVTTFLVWSFIATHLSDKEENRGMGC